MITRCLSPRRAALLLRDRFITLSAPEEDIRMSVKTGYSLKSSCSSSALHHVNSIAERDC